MGLMRVCATEDKTAIVVALYCTVSRNAVCFKALVVAVDRQI